WFEHILLHAVPEHGFLLGYHIPPVTGIGFSLDLLARLKEAFPQKFAGIKDSSHDSNFARALGARFGAELLVLTGTDSYLQLALQHAAQGCITAAANLLSPDLRRIWDGFLKGDEITPIQEHVTHQRHLLERYTPFPPLMKALLARLHGLPRWAVRPPLLPLPAEKEEDLLRLWHAQIAHA
ncbi:MAG: dihydrodipicolinate synthase family protein, partial [Anaerolineales bacterium]